MAAVRALQNLRRPLCQGHALRDEPQRRVLPARATIAALVLALRQIVAPVGIVGATDLRIDETLDGFGTKHRTPVFPSQATSNLFRRVPVRQAFQHHFAQFRLPRQTRTAPTTRPSLILRVDRPVADLGTSVAFQFPAERRCRAIHSCSDLPTRLPGFLKPGNRTPLFQ